MNTISFNSPSWALYKAEQHGYYTIQDFNDQLWKVRYHKQYGYFSIEHESGDTYCHHEALSNGQAQEAIQEILLYSL
jgi:hypothetical protein